MRMPLARESVPFIIALAVVTLGVGARWPAAALVPLVLLGFVLWFFRDPERTVPEDSRAVLSPADGRVVKADPERVSVFLNIFNVHVCRSPVAGRVVSVVRTPGRFLAAFKDEASEHNERTRLELRGETHHVRLTLVAGLIARRIVTHVRDEDSVAAGQRVGIIRFGSRADVDLPRGCALAVSVGDKVVAGETVLARLPDAGS